MSTQSKMVQGLSIFMLLVAIINIVVGLIMLFNAQSAPVIPGISNSVIVAEVGGVVLTVTGLVFLVDAILGLRGAKDPAKLGAYIALSVVIAVVNIAEYLMILFGGTGDSWQYILLACVALLGAYNANQAREA